MEKSLQISLSKPALIDADIEAARLALESGRLVSGRIVETFERTLAAYIGTAYAVCVSSGTAALHLGLLALDIGQGDDVIVPAFGYPAGANAVEMVGARPVFVDSEPGGFNVNINLVENSITSRTRGIMIVHNFGWPVDAARIQSLSAKYKIPIIEDSACALGSSTGNAMCGSLGKLAVFSFHSRKIVTTGEGGAVVTNNLELAERLKRLRNHGQDRSNGSEFVIPGLNYNMTEFQAALGVSQMKRLDSILRERISAADYYNKNLRDVRFLRPVLPDSSNRVNYQAFIAFVSGGLRGRVIEFLNTNGIEAGIGSYSIPHTGFYSSKYGYGNDHFSASANAYHNLVSLPLYGGITREEQNHVIETLRKLNCRDEDRQSEQTMTSSRGYYE